MFPPIVEQWLNGPCQPTIDCLLPTALAWVTALWHTMLASPWSAGILIGMGVLLSPVIVLILGGACMLMDPGSALYGYRYQTPGWPAPTPPDESPRPYSPPS